MVTASAAKRFQTIRALEIRAKAYHALARAFAQKGKRSDLHRLANDDMDLAHKIRTGVAVLNPV